MLLNTTKIAAATTKNRRSANNMVNVGTQSIFETLHLEKKNRIQYVLLAISLVHSSRRRVRRSMCVFVCVVKAIAPDFYHLSMIIAINKALL